LSPETSKIAERQGSKTNKIRTSLALLEPGRNSFKFLIFASDRVNQRSAERGP